MMKTGALQKSINPNQIVLIYNFNWIGFQFTNYEATIIPT